MAPRYPPPQPPEGAESSYCGASLHHVLCYVSQRARIMNR